MAFDIKKQLKNVSSVCARNTKFGTIHLLSRALYCLCEALCLGFPILFFRHPNWYKGRLQLYENCIFAEKHLVYSANQWLPVSNFILITSMI